MYAASFVPKTAIFVGQFVLVGLCALSFIKVSVACEVSGPPLTKVGAPELVQALDKCGNEHCKTVFYWDKSRVTWSESDEIKQSDIPDVAAGYGVWTSLQKGVDIQNGAGPGQERIGWLDVIVIIGGIVNSVALGGGLIVALVAVGGTEVWSKQKRVKLWHLKMVVGWPAPKNVSVLPSAIMHGANTTGKTGEQEDWRLVGVLDTIWCLLLLINMSLLHWWGGEPWTVVVASVSVTAAVVWALVRLDDVLEHGEDWDLYIKKTVQQGTKTRWADFSEMSKQDAVACLQRFWGCSKEVAECGVSLAGDFEGTFDELKTMTEALLVKV